MLLQSKIVYTDPQISPLNPTAHPQANPQANLNLSSSSNPTENERFEKIKEIFQTYFDEEFKSSFNSKTSTNLEDNFIKNCQTSLTQSKKLKISDNKINYLINFSMEVNITDFSKNKKYLENEREIGFFNFKLSEYTTPQSKYLISYFSEVSFGKRYQGKGLFSLIFNAYNRTLSQLNVDLDYLHVKSDNPATASIYKKKGYQFTPVSTNLITTTYGSIEEYLSNSSVNYQTENTIEMYRTLSYSSIRIETSISDIEHQITHS